MDIETALSLRFAALADPTRRAILARLAQGDATVTELRLPFRISQPALSKHLKVLGAAGLIEAGQVGQTRPRRLKPEALRETGAWFEPFATFWGESFDRLDAFLQDAAAPPAKGNDDA